MTLRRRGCKHGSGNVQVDLPHVDLWPSLLKPLILFNPQLSAQELLLLPGDGGTQPGSILNFAALNLNANLYLPSSPLLPQYNSRAALPWPANLSAARLPLHSEDQWPVNFHSYLCLRHVAFIVSFQHFIPGSSLKAQNHHHHHNQNHQQWVALALSPWVMTFEILLRYGGLGSQIPWF